MGTPRNPMMQEAILKLIKQGFKASQIAKELKVTRGALTYHTKKMIKEGLILSQNLGIQNKLTLTPKGARGVVDSSTRNAKQATKRFHAYGLRYQRLGTLKGALEPAQIFREAKEATITITTLNNTTQATIKADITTKLTTQSLILYAPSLYYHRGAPAITMEAEAKKVLDQEAERWERKLGIKLRRVRLGVLWSEVVQEEIADEHHPLGEAATQDGGQVVLARHRDGKARLIGDKSMKSFAELETVHRASAGEDSDRLDRVFNKVLDGQIDLEKVEKIDRLEEDLVKYAHNEIVHLDLLNKIRAENQKIKDMLSQRRLMP